MKIRIYNAGSSYHWGRSFRLEWGTKGLAVVLCPHPSLWQWIMWHRNFKTLRSVALYVGPIGLVYANKRVKQCQAS